MKNQRFTMTLAIAGALTILIALGTAQAQESLSPLSLGSVSGVSSTTCPTVDKFSSGTSCFSATVNCPSTVGLAFIYGEIGSGTAGTIVIFNGGGGNTGAGGTDFVSPYTTAGYRVVQVVWNSAWEATGTGTSNIKTAGCRPATVLNYVFTSIYSAGGMCAQGTSAGSAAIGYALAEYGAGSYLDNVELLSGPVLSDIEKGCVVPNTPSITVCPKSQAYCQTGTEGGWPDAPQYIGGDITSINNWSGSNSCNGSSNTTPAQNSLWKQMSVVDGLSDSTFSYPHTAVAGWLCSNTSVSCGSQPCQNNSAAEGQYFYVQVSTGTEPYNVWRVDQCSGQEGVTSGTLAANGKNGFNAIEADMVASCKLHH
ncbi:MAG: hypothetical protein WB729_20520 [Candidatus Sulfotelmatobacter sp.]